MSQPPQKPDPQETQTSLAGFEVLPDGSLVAERYRISELLGIGGVGMVYRARDLRLDMDVALKVMRPEHAPDPQAFERFKQEILLGRQISHRNVVRIHDIGQDGHLQFLIMDWVAGQSLKQILDRDGRLDPATAVGIARDLAAALDVAHQEGIVHRDLKPANVLVGQDRALITDFGIARSFGGSGMTRTGVVVGTLDYLSPEQARGGNVDGRTDIYALGLVLYEMLSGRRPFGGETVDEVLAARALGEARTLTPDEAPAWLARVVERCLQRRPEDRYQGARELHSDLERESASRPRRPLDWRKPVATAALIAALAVPAFYFIAPRDPPARATADARSVDLRLAVLPFVDLTGSPEYAWVKTGLPELLAQKLAANASLSVAEAARSHQTLTDLSLTPGALAAADWRQLEELLDVSRLIGGKVYRDDQRLRIEAELKTRGVDALHPIIVEGAAADGIFVLIERLAAATMKTLDLGPPRGDPVGAGVAPEVMNVFAEGVDRLTTGDHLAAAKLLEQAVDADPAFALGWLRLAHAYRQLGRDRDALNAAVRAEENLGSASDRVSFEVRATRAALSGNLEAAIETLRNLVAAYPNDVQARVAYATALGDHGSLSAAREELRAVVADSPNHPEAWYLLGKFAILQGDARAALDEYLVRALVIQNRLANAQGQGDVLNALGIAHHQAGDLARAEQSYQQAAEKREAAGDRRGMATALANLARIHAARGQPERARTDLEAALSELEAIGDQWAVANLHNEIGFLEESLGAYPSALERYRAALKIRREIDDLRALAESYNNVGYAYFLLGEYDNAAVYADQALTIYQNTGNEEGETYALQTAGFLNLARGRWEDALKPLLRALELARGLGQPQAQAVALGNIGRVQQYQGRHDAAMASYQEALAIVTELEDPRGLAAFTLFTAEQSLELGMLEDAAAALDAVAGWLEGAHHQEQRAELSRLQSLLASRRGSGPQALSAAQAALEAAQASGSVVAQLKAGLALAEARLLIGELAEARDRAARVAARARELGHAIVLLAGIETEARVALAAGRHADAERAAAAGLEVAAAHRPYAGEYRLHLLRAEALEQLDRVAQAQVHRASATAEIERLRGHLSGATLDSFNRITSQALTMEDAHVSGR